MYKKSGIVLVFLTLCLISFNFPTLATTKVDQEQVYHVGLMKQLVEQGFDWGDLVEASEISNKFHLNLTTILELRPKGFSWTQVENALSVVASTREIIKDPNKLKDNAPIMLLVKNGFTEEEIAYLIYNVTLFEQNIDTVVSIEIAAAKDKKIKPEHRVKGNPETSLFSVSVEDSLKTGTMGVLAGENPDSSSTTSSIITYEDPGYGYDTDKCAPFGAITENKTETVNPITGALMITESDLVLPGKNGLDFVLTRVYRSEKSMLSNIKTQYLSSTRLGYEVSFDYPVRLICSPLTPNSHEVVHVIKEGTFVGTAYTDQTTITYPSHVFNTLTHKSFTKTLYNVPVREKNGPGYVNTTYGRNYLNSIYHLGIGWGFDLPSIEISDYGRYLHMGQGNTFKIDSSNLVTGLKDVTSKEYIYKSYSNTRIPEAKHIVKHKGGINYYFNEKGLLIRIQNIYNNSIKFEWTLKEDNLYYLAQVVDTLDRIIQFTYNDLDVLVTVNSQSEPYTIRYVKEKLSGYDALKRVELPLKTNLNYTYSFKSVKYNLDQEKVPYEANRSYMYLTSSTNPYGGITYFDYTNNYNNQIFKRGLNTKGYEEVYRVYSRYDLADSKKQNFIFYEYPSLYQTNIYHCGENSLITAWKRKESLHFNSENLNDLITTYISDKPNYVEKTIITYVDKMPSYIKVIKDDKVSTYSIETDVDYNSYGTLLKSSDNEDHFTESGFSLKSIPELDVDYEQLAWTIQRVNPDNSPTNDTRMVKTQYNYNTNHHLSNIEEYDTKPTKVYQINQTLTVPVLLRSTGSSYTQEISPDTKSVKLTIEYMIGLVSNTLSYEIRYWEVGKSRPASYFKKISHPTTTPIIKDPGDINYPVQYMGVNPADPAEPGEPTPPTSGVDQINLTLDPAKHYNVEVLLSNKAGTLTTISVLQVEENTLGYQLGTTLKAKTHYIYSSISPNLPSEIHKHYGTSTLHGTAQDQCIVTNYEYRDEGVFDGTSLAAENYSDMFPTKITQKYIDADEKVQFLQTNLQYNIFGQITKVKKGNIIVDYKYDSLHRLTTEIHSELNSSGAIIKTLQKGYTYPDLNLINPPLTTTISYQDALGNTQNQHVTTYVYDKLGQLVETRIGANPFIKTESIVYDGFGRKKEVVDGTGRKVEYEYDGFGQQINISSKDVSGNKIVYIKTDTNYAGRTITEETYDVNPVTKIETIKGKTIKHLSLTGRLTQIDQYEDISKNTIQTTKYFYNLKDQVTSVIDPRNLTLGYEYDFFGLAKVVYSGDLRNDDVFIYETSQGVKKVKKDLGNGKYIEMEYDQLDRIKKIVDTDNSTLKNYYDANGRLNKSVKIATGETSQIEYNYDLTGNVKTQIHTYTSTSNGTKMYTINFTYDEAGKIKTINYDQKLAIEYQYDEYGRVKAIPGFIQNATYLNNNFMETIQYQNGITTTYIPDALGRIKTIKNRVMEFNYEQDGKGNITAVSSKKYVNGTLINNYSNSYVYDNLDRLTEGNLAGSKISYGYDASGNRTSIVKINGTISESTTYQYHPMELNLLNSINNSSPVNYDLWGNMTKKDLGNGYYHEYSYNLSNQLTKVVKKNVNQTVNTVLGEYFYDSTGKRYKKVENGSTTYYMYNGENVLFENTATGFLCYVSLNGNPVAKVEYDNNLNVVSKVFYHTDNTGSTRVVTDQSGNVMQKIEFGPFGENISWELTNTSVKPELLTFTGKELDQATGLYYFNARYYDPNLARFITEDPGKDGVNWQVYCSNNPLKYIDPNGQHYMYYSHSVDRIYWVDDNKNLLYSWECRDKIFNGVNEFGQPRASLPNGEYNCYALRPESNYGAAYGTFKIRTGDPRARIIHGGGSGLSKPFAPEQGWYATYGCLRMQNEDGNMLSQLILDHGNRATLYVHTETKYDREPFPYIQNSHIYNNNLYVSFYGFDSLNSFQSPLANCYGYTGGGRTNVHELYLYR